MYGSAAEWQAKNGGGSWSALIYSTIGRVAIGRVTIGRVSDSGPRGISTRNPEHCRDAAPDDVDPG